MNPTDHAEKSAEILIPAVGYWRHLRTRTFLLFCQNHGHYKRGQDQNASEMATSSFRKMSQIIFWWVIAIPSMCIGSLVASAMSFPVFLFNKQAYRDEICQPTIRLNYVNNHLVINFEAWSVFLHPAIWRLRSLGKDWVICHPIWPSDRPFVLIPKKAIPAEWLTSLSEQLQPRPTTAAA
jgi:hypothetical protein